MANETAWLPDLDGSHGCYPAGGKKNDATTVSDMQELQTRMSLTSGIDAGSIAGTLVSFVFSGSDTELDRGQDTGRFHVSSKYIFFGLLPM